MANNELSTEMRELNEKLSTSIIKIMAKTLMAGCNGRYELFQSDDRNV